MIEIIFDSESKKLEKQARLILSKIGIDINLKIVAKKSDRLYVANSGDYGNIEYITDVSFFRMLTIFMKEYKKEKCFEYEEKIHFEHCGPMLDMSRNAVLKVEKIKEYIEYIAMMGLNRLVLYLEDTFELKEYPYFGYMRGHYSKEELKEIDRYALEFGIEVFPAIQTLGHMERYLQWDESVDMRDTASCLMVEEEATYKLIDSMMETISECFSCKKVHVGMDEAYDFGLGKYLRKHGYKDRGKLMLKHLCKVREIAQKHGLSIAAWSDTFFRLVGANHNSCDIDIDDSIRTQIPQDITLVHWCYYEEKEETYDKMFQIHNKMSDKVSFAGAVENYFGYTCDTWNTYRLSQAALNSCKRSNIKDIYATVWMDNGAESDFFLSLCGVQLYAENMYNEKNCEEKAKENFEFITGAKFDAFMDMSQFHNIFDGREYAHYWLRYNGKKFLYQDILTGLNDRELIERPMSEHYSYYAQKMSEYIDGASIWDEYYRYAKILFEAIALKCEIAEKLKKAYDEKNIDYLQLLCSSKLDDLYKKMSELKDSRMDMWYKNNKAFGGEVLDIRLAGVLARIITARERLLLYVDGKIDKLEELEEERLPFNSFGYKIYSHLVTAGIM